MLLVRRKATDNTLPINVIYKTKRREAQRKIMNKRNPLEEILTKLEASKSDLEDINYILPLLNFKTNENSKSFINKLDEIVEAVKDLLDFDFEVEVK
jgi:chromosome condensin MukBEF ATPase and DNA-binding subunit MukB